MKVHNLAIAALLLGCLPAYADEAPQTGAPKHYTLSMSPDEVETAFQALRAVPRPNFLVDPLMLSIQKQVADQNKAQEELNAKSHAAAVAKDAETAKAESEKK